MSRRKRQQGLFDQANYQEQIRAMGTVTNRIAEVVNLEGLRGKLERLAPVHSGDKGGRPDYDRVMMFKILLLQSLHQLSDELTEVQIVDRMSFRLFLGLDRQAAFTQGHPRQVDHEAWPFLLRVQAARSC